ncbi:MAG: FmdB family zinc ribbon protein, partial [Acidimicrobiia bacterium]
MPTYEYLCKNCGERFERVQSFSARPLKKHDACGGELQKVFHASGVVFKGPGFYATDSRATRSSSDSSSDSSAPSDSPKPETTSKKDGSKKPKKESRGGG